MNPACWAGLAVKAHCSSASCGWAPFSVQHRKNLHWSHLQDFQFVCTSKVAQVLDVKSVNLSGCLDLWQCVKDSHQNLAPSSILPLKEWPDSGIATGLCGCAPQGQWMGSKIQQISLIWRVGEYAEASTMYIHPSLPLLPISCAKLL